MCTQTADKKKNGVFRVIYSPSTHNRLIFLTALYLYLGNEHLLTKLDNPLLAAVEQHSVLKWLMFCEVRSFRANIAMHYGNERDNTLTNQISHFYQMLLRTIIESPPDLFSAKFENINNDHVSCVLHSPRANNLLLRESQFFLRLHLPLKISKQVFRKYFLLQL